MEFKINKVTHKDWELDDERQKWINYAYNIWGKDFLFTILAENWTMWIDRKSWLVWANWYSEYWICQINVWWHPEILSNWKNWKRFVDRFYDPYKQIDYCWKKYSWWTKFYWYNVRMKIEKKIDFK